MKIRPVGAELFYADRQTEGPRQTDMMTNSSFLKFWELA